MSNKRYFCITIRRQKANWNAKVAQLVERDLAKVEVAGSNPVFRSTKRHRPRCFFCVSRDGGIGRRAGLKILWAVRPVRVRFPLLVQG